MRFFYDIFLHFLALGFLFSHRKYWKRLKYRLGFGFPKIEKNGRALIWVHAVSLGETRAVAPLVKKLKATGAQVVLSTVTDTGFAEGQRAIPEADFHVYLPWDFSYIIRRIVKKISPDLVILTETDFWWNFQSAAKECGASLVLVNGKISKRSFQRMLRFPFVCKALLHSIDLLCVQGEVYARRFTALGVSEEKIVVTGNLKLDGFVQESGSEVWKQRLNISEKDLVLTIGSTHDPEEKILVGVVKKLEEKFPNLKVLLVPRHPERFDHVEEILKDENVNYSRLTTASRLGSERVILVDLMGNLRKCYQISHLAFVGGSLTSKVGGHNILEPSFYGVPVLFGPHMHSQPDFLDQVLSNEAGIQVSEESLVEVLDRLLENDSLRRKIGQNGLKVIREGQGTLEQTWQAMISCDKIKGRDRLFPLSRDGAVVSSLGS